jgi:hypothetical protein
MWRTQDEHDEENPYKGLPDKQYIRNTLDVYDNEDVVLIEKSRQMMVSTFTCGYVGHHTLFKRGRLWLISKTKEKDAVALMRDKIRGPWSRTPKWFQEAMPMSKTPAEEIFMPESGSRIMGVTQNVASSSGRGVTASGVFVDEAAFQDMLRDIWAAIIPMARKLIAVTTPSLDPGGVFLKTKFDRATNGTLLLEYMKGFVK